MAPGLLAACSVLPSDPPAPGQVHMLRKAKQKPKKAGTPKDARADEAPTPEGASSRRP